MRCETAQDCYFTYIKRVQPSLISGLGGVDDKVPARRRSLLFRVCRSSQESVRVHRRELVGDLIRLQLDRERAPGCPLGLDQVVPHELLRFHSLGQKLLRRLQVGLQATSLEGFAKLGASRAKGKGVPLEQLGGRAEEVEVREPGAHFSRVVVSCLKSLVSLDIINRITTRALLAASKHRSAVLLLLLFYKRSK